MTARARERSVAQRLMATLRPSETRAPYSATAH